MFGDIGWAELLLIGIVALIVIGPEDLPQMFRQVGRFTAKLRAMSRDFSRAMDQAAKESGVKDVTDTVKGATSATSMGLNKVKAAADRFEKWDPIKSATAKPTASPLVPPSMPASSMPAASMPATSQSTLATAIAEPAIHGAETQALLKKQTAKKAVLLQTAEKLKAIQSGIEETDVQTRVPAVTPVNSNSADSPTVDASLPKPRAARKSKKVGEA